MNFWLVQIGNVEKSSVTPDAVQRTWCDAVLGIRTGTFSKESVSLGCLTVQLFGSRAAVCVLCLAH